MFKDVPLSYEEIERIWLREIALVVIDKRSLSQEEEYEKWSKKKLADYLSKEYGFFLRFKTYQQIRKCRNFKRYPFIVLDEWHRFNIFDYCKSFIEESGNPHILAKSAKGSYGNHTFFVSATPMNPVLEQEAENLNEDPKDDDEMITEGRKKALYTIMGLLGNNNNEDICSIPFAKAVKKLGVKWKKKDSGWQKPESRQHCNTDEENWIRSCELKYFKQASDYERNEIDNWKSQEAAWAIGLVRTYYNKRCRSFELVKNKKSMKKSFGFKYTAPYIATECGNIKDAGKWLIEKHTRVKRLIERLLGEKILIKDDDGKITLTKKKCLIFCIHQGVARGLQYALLQVVAEPKKNIVCSVIEFDEKKEREFNTKDKPPYILIATDKMSESIDLHNSCNTIIHYELPWSPLRLLQRIGRLTRKHSNGRFEGTYVYHIIIPVSVEEERVNRLIRRTWLLEKEGAWPKELIPKGDTEKNCGEIARSLIGDGPSLHLKEYKTCDAGKRIS